MNLFGDEMEIVGIYSFNNGQNYLLDNHQTEWSDIQEVVQSVDSEKYKTKVSEEKTKNYKMLYSPRKFNKAYKNEFSRLGWKPKKVPCDYKQEFYINGYQPPPIKGQPSREMDFLKNRVGVEVQFGKYAFMVYNVAAKMTIFSNLGFIEVGVEIVPVKELQQEMSPGVSDFEQFVWDLEQRGVSNIDIPVLVLGIRQNVPRP
jgi:hypothetical protein